VNLDYAEGFSVQKAGKGITEVTVHTPWPGASRPYRYALVERDWLPRLTLDREAYDAIIPVPVRKLVLTSTTHIPALEALEAEDRLIGFPGLDYVSSKKTRHRIQQGLIRELGANDQLNTEMVLELKPDLVIGFGISGSPRSYQGLIAAGIPVLFNGDWTEQHPLAKAEWLKLFGFLLGKEDRASEHFNAIANSYKEVQKLAESADERPRVLSGALYRDVWYLPGGTSWAATFIRDAQADYLWRENEESGSLSLSVEAVLERAEDADYWIAPSQYTSYSEMETANPHYGRIRAFKKRKVFTYALSKGPTGGMLYFELGPNRPDLVLKDLVHFLHPELLPEYDPVFFKPMKP
jgi:iron complex transport system substrate-binding protein